MPFKNLISKNNTALFLAILFHLSGLIGILLTQYKSWFIEKTTLNLLLMFALLLFVQERKDKHLLLFFCTCFFIGMLTEIIGVNTGIIFGNYSYGNIMGIKYKGVPLLIGVNWFNVIFCSGILANQIADFIKNRFKSIEMPSKHIINYLLTITLGSLIATLFDFIIEPVAIKLDFWQWKNNVVPIFNYISWFIISFLLLVLFNQMKLDRKNSFAMQLLLIQYLFFLALNAFL